MADNLPNSGKFYTRKPQEDVEMQHLWKVMDDLQQAILDGALSVQEATALLSGYVQSVTGLDTDNTDPQNPVIQIAVDGVTITGSGTIASPLIADFSTLVESVTAEANIPVVVDNSDTQNPVIGYEWPVQTQTTDFTLALTDAWTDNVCDTVSSIEITVPANASVAFPIGTEIMFGDVDSGLTFFTPDTGVTIHSRNSWTGIDGPGGVVRLTKVDTNEWFLDGDLKLALDVDAEAYINAVEATGVTFTLTEKTYINNWFLSAKSSGYYSKYHLVYLFLGGTAAAHKFNAINPVDSDAAFRLVDTGSPTHNANGITYNGTTQHSNTKFVPSAHLNQDSKHYAVYIRSTGGNAEYGVVNASAKGDWMAATLAGETYQSLSKIFTTLNPAPTVTKLWQHNRDTSTNCIIQRNGVTIITDTGATDHNPANEVFLGARANVTTVVLRAACNLSFFAIGDEFTTGELADELTHVNQLQTDFGRNV